MYSAAFAAYVHNKMVSYRKLWVRLAERELKKKDLCRVAGISATVVTKLGRGESVTTDVLARICLALECDFGDIMEIVDTEREYHTEK